MDRKALLFVTLFVEGGLFVFGLLLMGGSGSLSPKFLLSWGATGWALLLSIPMFVGLYITSRSEWGPLTRFNDEIKEKVAPIFANCNVIDLALIAFLAGTGEELFFRGWLQGALASRLGVTLGILLASGIFGFAHYLSPTYAIYAGLTGLYLGAIYHISGNLYVVMGIHALYDFVALVYLVRKGNGKDQELRTTGNAEEN